MQHLIFIAAANPQFPAGLHRVALPVAGVVCGGVALLLMVKRKPWRRTQSVLMFIAGLALAGAGGLIRDRIEQMLTKAGSATSGLVFGVAVSWVIAAVLVLWFVLDMDVDGLINKARKKSGGVNRHQATAFTPWLALFVPTLLTTLPFVTDVIPAVEAALR
ncbi:MAG TPA: hypothetical protein VFX70_11325 [Mycobacteriales bacterium]|nr:hypothetical protein [Mycobacteriales bacterium]